MLLSSINLTFMNRPGPEQIEGMSDKDKKMMEIQTESTEDQKARLASESELRKEKLAATDAKSSTQMDRGQIQSAIEQNELKRLEFTKQVERVQQTIDAGNSTRSKDDLVRERERLNGEILKLNQEDKALRQKQ